jgi:hypothetical protein
MILQLLDGSRASVLSVIVNARRELSTSMVDLICFCFQHGTDIARLNGLCQTLCRDALDQLSQWRVLEYFGTAIQGFCQYHLAEAEAMELQVTIAGILRSFFGSTHSPVALSSVNIDPFLFSLDLIENNSFWMQFAAEFAEKIKLTPAYPQIEQIMRRRAIPFAPPQSDFDILQNSHSPTEIIRVLCSNPECASYLSKRCRNRKEYLSFLKRTPIFGVFIYICPNPEFEELRSLWIQILGQADSSVWPNAECDVCSLLEEYLSKFPLRGHQPEYLHEVLCHFKELLGSLSERFARLIQHS